MQPSHYIPLLFPPPPTPPLGVYSPADVATATWIAAIAIAAVGLMAVAALMERD